jgi:hypothetical protein
MAVFISHSFANKPEYDNVVDALMREEVDYWNPGSIKPGHSLRDQLRNAIECCTACIFIATRDSLGSSWCGTELGGFWIAKKPIIVYIAESAIKETELPPVIQGDVWERRIKRVVERAKEIVSQNSINARRLEGGNEFDEDSVRQVSLAVRAISSYLVEAEDMATRNQGLALALMQTLSSWRLAAADWSKGEVRLMDSSTTNYVVRMLYNRARISVFSTCAEQYLDQWATPHGDALCRAHATSTAQVTRVFLFSSWDDITPSAEKIFDQQAMMGIKIRIFINDETAFSFPPEISQDFTVIDDGVAIGVTTAFTTPFSGEPQTQATWYFENINRIDSYRQMVLGLTADDVLTHDQYNERSGR